jgi:hypothetical protein
MLTWSCFTGGREAGTFGLPPFLDCGYEGCTALQLHFPKTPSYLAQREFLYSPKLTYRIHEAVMDLFTLYMALLYEG